VPRGIGACYRLTSVPNTGIEEVTEPYALTA
jgi:hypothetical protein